MERYVSSIQFMFISSLLHSLLSLFNLCFFSRKIEIVQFASRTRQLFVRLLALVKWASNAGKVEKCAVCFFYSNDLACPVKAYLLNISKPECKIRKFSPDHTVRTLKISL